MHYLAPILFKAMTSFVPISNHSYYESATTTENRYKIIANDIASGSEHNSVFANDDSGIKMGLLLVSLASKESAYRNDIFTCAKGGDHDMSWTIFQMQRPYAPKERVCADFKVAVEYAIKIIRISFDACKNLLISDRLSAYATGRCISNNRLSRERVGPAIDFYNANKHLIESTLALGF